MEISGNIENKEEPTKEKVIIDDRSLAQLAIYLEGIKAGKGNLLPLGTVVLEDLWNAIAYLRGDSRYKASRDSKN